MINASKEFKEKLKKGANVVNYADITLSDGTVLHLEPKDFMIGGCEIEDKTTDGKFGIGFVIGKTLTLRISNHEGQFSRYDFYNSIINLYAALLLDDGTIEKIRKGVYYTLVPETPGDIIEISAVDGMYKLDKDYAANNTVYPATLQKIITDVCLDCGIPIGFTQFDNMTFVVQTKPENATTYRQVMSWACQIAGYNARIDNTGYMKLIWYNESLLDGYIYNGGDFYTYPHDTVVDGGNFKDYTTTIVLFGGNFTDDIAQHISKVKSINVHTDDIQITGVRVHGEEETFSLFGEEGYVIEVKDNPFSAGRENEVASYLGNRMVGMVFRPFDAEVLSNPLYEPFEVVRVSDAKGNVYLSLVNSITYKIGSFTRIACEAEDPVRNGSTYVSAAAQAVVEARRNAQKQISEYDKAVQNMNQLTANAMGLFRADEKQSNGSYIYYESTKPITIDANGKCHFESGSTVYKRQGEGFFVSRDGGKTYESGFDENGIAILNVLYAIGISFDWARGGTLTLGGKDNQNGSFEILDGNGNIVTYGDSENFYFKKFRNSTAGLKRVFTLGMKEYRWRNTQISSIGLEYQDKIAYVADFPYPNPEEAHNHFGWGSIAMSPIGRLDDYNISSGFEGGIDFIGSGDYYIRTFENVDQAVFPYIYMRASDQEDFGDMHLAIKGKMSIRMYSNGSGMRYFDAPGISYQYSESDGGIIMTLARSVKISSKTRGAASVDLFGGDSYTSKRFAIGNECIMSGSLANTTTSPANVCVTSSSFWSKVSSSSKRYKDIKRNLEEEDVEKLYSITPVMAKYKNGYLSKEDRRCDAFFPMFIAEDIEEHFPDATEYNEYGEVEDWNYRIIIPAMFQMIKSQKKTIDNLTERLERLESILLKGSV